MSIAIQDLYQELIIDHGTKPRNCCAMADHNYSALGFNPFCGDKIKLFLKIVDGVIIAATFEGGGCAIATASASIMTEILPGNNIAFAMQLVQDFSALLLNENSVAIPNLGKLQALATVKNFPSRVKCASLAWHTLTAALKNQAEISTE